MTSNLLLSLAAAFFCSVLALFVLFRDRHSLVHRSFGAGMMALAIEAIFAGLSMYSLSSAEVVRWQRLRFATTAVIPGIWLLFSLTFGRANFKDFLTKWKWAIVAAFVLPFGLVTVFGKGFFAGDLIPDSSSVGRIRIGWPGYFFHLFFLISAAFILVNLERTLRTSSGRMRWQIKFMVLGLGSFFGARIYVASQTILFKSVNLDLELINSTALIVAGILIVKALFRTRLFNVDFYVSQSFLYNSFAIVAIGIYLLGAGALAKIATDFEGLQALPFGAFFLPLALFGLAVLLLSDRLRKRMKYFISRHLKRPIYDYRKEWAKFTEGTTSVTGIKHLCSIVTKMVSKTLDVLSVTIWLVNETQEGVELGGSTVFSEKQIQEHPPIQRIVSDLIRVIRQKKYPLDFDYSEESWAEEGGASTENFFHQTQIRYCIPLIANGRFLGLMTLGDGVGQDYLSVENFDLLKTIGDQTAGSLLNLKLSADLRQAREMEAFQTLSAFFVHDLKNLASRLSLTMQNLPIHFANPDFRNDVVRMISDSMAKINGMCSRLSSLSQKLELQRTEIDLNEFVKNSLFSLNECLKAAPVQDLQPMPRVPVDPEQMEKVLFNLVLNANEAMGEGGEGIRVTTMQQDDFAVISVCDNGCGMSREFMEQSLFRPFKTTNKQGMGIGLYQSKRIVEAHQGRIDVESEEGRGTTFRVLLPIHSPAKE